MAAQAALNSRKIAAAALKTAISQLERYKDKPNPNPRLLQQKLRNLIEHKDDLTAKHYLYTDKAGVDLEEEEHVKWLSERVDEAVDLADEVFLIIDDVDTRKKEDLDRQQTNDQKANEKQIAQLQYQTDENYLRESIDNLSKVVDSDVRTANDAVLAKAGLEEVELALQEQIKSWDAIKSILTEEAELKGIFDKEEDIKKLVATKRVQTIAFIKSLEPPDSGASKVSMSGDASGNVSGNVSTKNAIVKTEKLATPTFNGNIRTFAQFKGDFTAVIAPHYPDKVHQVHLLKYTALKGPAKALVENLSDLEEIWKRLESRYGDSLEIVNLVVSDIENLSFNKKEPDKGMISLVDTLEKGVRDLEAINSKHEIANAYTVKLLETKLPSAIYTKWLEKEDENNTASTSSTLSTSSTTPGVVKSRFENMLDFLTTERKHAERRLMLKKGDVEDKKDASKRNNFSGTVHGNDPKKSRNMCLIHPHSNHFTRKCKAFLNMVVEERGKIVFEKQACKLCLTISHIGQDCPFLTKWQPCNVSGCSRFHSNLLHGCTIQYCHTQLTQLNMMNKTILLMQKVKVTFGYVNSLWDNGSTISLITEECAKRNKLHGIPVEYDLVTVGNKVVPQETLVYQFNILDITNKPHTITAFQIENICGSIQSVNTKKLARLFKNATAKSISRPQGSIDLLIGMDNADIHPKEIESREGLVLYSSIFGSGKVIGGKHKDVVSNEMLNSHALCARTSISNVRMKRFVETSEEVLTTGDLGVDIPPRCDECRSCECFRTGISNMRMKHCFDKGVDFFTAEDLGVKIPPRCKKCRECKDCRFETQQLSRIEQAELTVIRTNITLDPVNKVFTTKYPYKTNPKILKNNKSQVHALMLKTEKQLMSDPIVAEKYNGQVDDLIERGVLVEISKEEEEHWTGPVNYVSHHVVYKPESSSTPVRLVVNSSLKYNGISFNDILMKGPNTIKNIFAIQLQFRTFLVALVGDIHKFYHSIHTTDTEKHLRRLLWRHMKTDEEPKTYGITRVMFGDKPAAAISSVAIQETAESFKHVDAVAADKLKNNTYVDDITTGADSIEEVNSIKYHIEDILSRVGMKIKEWVVSGGVCEETLSLVGSGKVGRVLGLTYDPSSDVFFIYVRINLSRKIKGARTEEDLTYEQIPRILEMVITLRVVLGIVHSCYDPYGLVSALTIQLKIELRKLFGCEVKVGWDDPLSDEIKARWVHILQVVKKAEKVQFKRCIRPKEPVSGKPILIVCNDGANEAMCATAHIRWPLTDGTFKCYLYAAKTRVTPLKKQTIPRIELQSAIMGVRLSKAICEHAGLEFEEVVHILDSKCTLAVLHKDSVALKEHMANRVSEAHDSTTAGQWNWTVSKENIADLGTRSSATVRDIDETSDWQLGRPWMSMPKDTWPISQDYTGVVIPEEELLKPLLVGLVDASPKKFDLERFKGRSYTLLLRVVALVKKIFIMKSFLRIPPLIAADIQIAEQFCIQLSMNLTRPEFNKGKFRSLGAHVDEDGIIVINSRALNEMRQHYGADRFPILTYNDPVSFIWMQHVHKEDHTGITRTVAKSRRKFWIIKARRLAEKVKNSCYRCRITDKVLAQQKMAPLPKSRTKIAPVFYQISMDLCGPVLIKDTVKKRCHMKVWIVIFNCTVTRAMYLDVTEDYSTDAILQTIRRFVSIRGCPSEIYSDQGSQLIAASKETAALVQDWDWSTVLNWSATQGIKWTLAPAEGQHTNGLSESLIRSVKRSLKNKITSNVLTFSQLQMVLFEVANIINSRPIGVVTGSDPEQPCPITPNDLILGRATSAVPQGPFDSQNARNITKRFQFLQSLVTSWWNTWYQTVFPSLVPSYKWLQRHRNVSIGDVCLIRYRNDVRATYRLGRVVEVKKGSDGLIRTIVLKYKLPNENVFRTVDRPVQGVSVIVPVEEQENILNPNAEVFTPSQ